MTTTPHPWEALHSEAIRVLTTAAHESTDSDDGLDFADFLAHVLASTAANVGGPERLLARRPGSWEASHIAELLRGTVGEEPDAWWSYRTQPLTVTLNIAQLIETGEHHPGLLGLDDAIDLVGARYTSIDLDDEAALDAWDDEIDQLIHRYKTEYRNYADRFTVMAAAAAAAMAPPIDVHMVVDVDPHSPWWNPTTITNPAEDDADQLAVAIWHAAHDAAALPNVEVRPMPTLMSTRSAMDKTAGESIGLDEPRLRLSPKRGDRMTRLSTRTTNHVVKAGPWPAEAPPAASMSVDKLTLAQLCEELQIARSTFYDWRAKGRAPKCIKLPNGDLRVRRADLERWLAGLEEADT